MLYPDMVVVYDEVVSEDPVEWSWLLHSPGDMDLRQDTSGGKTGRFIFTSDDVSGLVDVYGATDLEWKVTNKYEIPAENWRGKKNEEGERVELEDNDWHLSGISKMTGDMRYLAIFQVGASREWQEVTMDDEGRYHCGDWVINASLDAGASTGLEAYRNDGRAAFATGRDEVRLGEEVFEGAEAGSAKLVEMIGGKPVMTESGDRLPASVMDALRQSVMQ